MAVPEMSQLNQRRLLVVLEMSLLNQKSSLDQQSVEVLYSPTPLLDLEPVDKLPVDLLRIPEPL